MKTTLYLLTLLIILLCIHSTSAQQLNFYKVPERPNKLIATFTGIAQDKQGFIWLSSYQGGLHRYDGTGYTTYMNDPLNTNSISSNYSECLMIDTADIIWIGMFGKGLDRFEKSTNTFTHYTHDEKNKRSIANDTVTSIIQDHEGNIWVGTYGGLDLFNQSTKSFTHYAYQPGDTNSLSYNHVRIVYEDKDGDIWVGCGSPFTNDRGEQPADGGLNKLNRKTGKFIRYLHNKADANTIENNKVSAIFQDSKMNLWIGTRGDGLHILNKKTGIFIHYHYDAKHPEKLSRTPVNLNNQNDHIRFIKEDATGAVWIGSWSGGLNRYDPETKTLKHYGQVIEDGEVTVSDSSSGFNEARPWLAFAGKDGLFWIASYSYPNSGNLYYVSYRSEINYYKTGFWVNNFFQENDSIQWLSTYSGLVRKNIKNNEQKIFEPDPDNPTALSNFPQNVVADDEGNLWIATDSGLNYYNQRKNSFTRYFHNDAGKQEIISNSLFCVFIDKNKNLWIGTDKGLDKMDVVTKQFHHYVNNPKDSNSIGNAQVICISEYENELWVGLENGLYRLNKSSGKFTRYLSPLIITSILVDFRGVLWVSTHQGFYFFNKEKNTFQPFNDPNSQITFSTVMNVQEDEKHNLWLRTQDAVIRINGDRTMVKIYGESYGVKTALYNSPGGAKQSDGKILFPSDYGYYAFNTDSLNDNTQPEIHLTAFKVNDVEVLTSSNGIIKLPLWQQQEIRLHHNQNNFSFDFLAVHYRSPGEEKYLYTLENYDKQWHYLNDEHKAYFFNVPPGDYILKIRAVNPDGQWSEKQIAISVSPPWYKTWWAYIIFSVAFVSLIWGIIHYRSVALRRENKLLEEKVSHRTEQLNQSLEELKSTQAQLIQSEKMASLGELTAGIAHEIQNPLNFVNNFSEVNNELIQELKIKNEELKIEDEEVKELINDIKQNLEKINHHGKRADAIVKGMLQHSKQTKGVKEPTDINALCDEYLRLSYHGLRAKDKSFNADFKTDFDNSIEKINIVPQDIGRALLNLFNNAFYAVNEKQKAESLTQNAEYKPLVSIHTKKTNNRVEITVTDNGNGIPSNIIDKIFQPFFTTKPTGQGTGLGLSLAYDIVTKEHNGTIKVESKEGEGTLFIINLLIA